MSTSFNVGLRSATANLGFKPSPIGSGELDPSAILTEGSVRKRLGPSAFVSPSAVSTPLKKVPGTGKRVPGSVSGAPSRLRPGSAKPGRSLFSPAASAASRRASPFEPSAELLRLRKEVAEAKAMKAEPPEPDADAQAEELAQLRELVEMQRLKLELHDLHQGVQGGNDRSTKRRAAFARERQDGRPLLSQDAENKVDGLLGKTGYKVHPNPLHNTFSILDPVGQVSDVALAAFGREKLAREYSAAGKTDLKKSLASWESAFRYFTTKGHFAKGPDQAAFTHLWLQLCAIGASPDGWKVAAQYFDTHLKFYLTVSDTRSIEDVFGLDSWDGRSDLLRNVDSRSLDAARLAARSGKGRSGGADFKGRKSSEGEYTVYCSHHKLYYTAAMDHNSDNCRKKGSSGKP